MKANITEVPLDNCREQFQVLKLSQLPDNLLQSQLCATNSKDGNIIDACQGKSFNRRWMLNKIMIVWNLQVIPVAQYSFESK